LLPTEQTWTNASVLKFAEGRDPVKVVVQFARDIVLDAIDKGWSGPPFDPMKLADLRGLRTSPRGDIRDARTVLAGHDRVLIEYNPNRPSGRLRYSIAHEIAHTFFQTAVTVSGTERPSIQLLRLMTGSWKLFAISRRRRS